MKKLLLILMLGMATMGVATTASARGHFHGGVFIGGPVWGPGWGPGYYPPYYAPQPVYVEPASPPVYVEQSNEDYWYYCAQPKAYYPYVKECPAGWMKVVPGSGPPR
jgi:hypothetical protein